MVERLNKVVLDILCMFNLQVSNLNFNSMHFSIISGREMRRNDNDEAKKDQPSIAKPLRYKNMSCGAGPMKMKYTTRERENNVSGIFARMC